LIITEGKRKLLQESAKESTRTNGKTLKRRAKSVSLVRAQVRRGDK